MYVCLCEGVSTYSSFFPSFCFLFLSYSVVWSGQVHAQQQLDHALLTTEGVVDIEDEAIQVVDEAIQVVAEVMVKVWFMEEVGCIRHSLEVTVVISLLTNLNIDHHTREEATWQGM